MSKLIWLLIVIFLLTLASDSRAFTAQDMADLACAKDCEHRDYTSGFSLPNGKCRCFDDILTLAKPLVKVPANLRGKMIYTEPKPTYTEF